MGACVILFYCLAKTANGVTATTPINGPIFAYIQRVKVNIVKKKFFRISQHQIEYT